MIPDPGLIRIVVMTRQLMLNTGQVMLRPNARCFAIVLLAALAACSDPTTAPPVDPDDDPPAGFEVEIPATVTQAQAFTLNVTALDAAGLPETTWSGTVSLTASGGTLAPASIALVNGSATAQVTLTGHVGTVAIRAANGSVQSDAVQAMVLSGAAPARLEIVPAAALLTAAGATQPFTVRAFDAQGAPTTATQLTWTSNDAAVLAVDSAGVATAQSAPGSAMITASANGIVSPPAVVLVAAPAAQAVLLADSQIVSAPAAVDPAAAYEPGWQYRVRVRAAAPAVGDIVIGTGEQPLAGRVVQITSLAGGESEITVELMALNQLFTSLRIDESIPMIERVGGTAPQSRLPGPLDGMPAHELPAGFAVNAETEFTLGRFKCTASGAVPSLDLPSPDLDITPDLRLQIGYDNGLERLAVAGTLTADVGYRPTFEAIFTGEATCETVLKTFTVPAHGIISFFYGVQVPLGIGFTLDGRLEVAEVGFDIQANATATVELGFSCAGGASCTGLDTFDMTRDGTLEFIAPDPSEQFRVELGGHAFVYARPFLGSLFTDALSFEFVDATAGLKQSVDLATTHYQVEDTAYASSFNLQFLATVGAGKDLTAAIQNLGKLLGTDLGASFNLIEIDDTLATSPKGTFTITPENVLPGDTTELGEMATFKVELDPVAYLGLYAVDKVEFFWKHDDSTGFTLGPGRPSCVEVAGSSGKTTFECETDFLEEHLGEQTFHAFVHAELFGVPLPLPLEIAANAAALVEVGGECTVPSYIREYETTNYGLRLADVDSSNTQRNDGAEVQLIRTQYNDLAVSVTNDNALVATADLLWRDYVRIIPEDLSRMDESMYIRYTARASATVHDNDETRVPGGPDYGALVHIGDANFLPVEGRQRVIVGGVNSPTYPGQEQFHIEADGKTFVRAGQWSRLEGHLYARANRDSQATAEHSFEVLDVVDANDVPVPVRICSALGYEYLPETPEPTT